MGLVSCVLKSALLWGKYQKNVWIALRKTFGPEFQIMYCWCRKVSHSPFLQVLDSFPPLLCPLLLRSATYTRTRSVVFKPYYSWILYRIHRLHSPLSLISSLWGDPKDLIYAKYCWQRIQNPSTDAPPVRPSRFAWIWQFWQSTSTRHFGRKKSCYWIMMQLELCRWWLHKHLSDLHVVWRCRLWDDLIKS